MPRASSTVLQASQTYQRGWENRLTAILATVLEQHKGFSAALLQEAHLPAGESYEARTELWVLPGRRIDLEVLAKNKERGVEARLWAENKRRGGSFTPRQREDYQKALDDQPGLGRLVTIVADRGPDDFDPPSEQPPDEVAAGDLGVAQTSGTVSDESASEGSGWLPLTWQVVAEIANSAGKGAPEPWGGSQWRHHALKPTAPASQRALYELIWYLEEEGYAVVDPLKPEHVESLRNASEAFTIIAALLSDVTSEIVKETRLRPSRLPQSDARGAGAWQDFEVPDGCWIGAVEGTIELVIWHDDAWTHEPEKRPAIGVGVGLDEEWYLALASNTAWVESAHQAGFELGEYDRWHCLFATKHLGEVVEDGRDIRRQADSIAKWAVPQIDRLLTAELDPGPVQAAGKPRGRGSRSIASPDQ